MDAAVKRWGKWIVALLAAACVWWAYDERQRHRRDDAITVDDDGGAVTRIVAAKMSTAGSLKVSALSGVIQSTARDVRFGGWLESVQVVKMPFTVDYFIDLRQFGARDLQWNAQSRTLVVDAPDVLPAPPNVDESRRTLVVTKGVFVTRAAADELSRKVSIHARDKAQEEALSPQRMAAARKNGRAALSKLLSAPLAAAGYGRVRVIITFPDERPATEQWDVTTPVNEALANRRR